MSEARNEALNVVKLEDFEEYQVIRDSKINDSDLPTINIKPVRKNPEIDSIPKDPIFTKEYLLRHKAILEENGYFARGDSRSPDSMSGKIVPKCSSVLVKPHFDVQEHRMSSHCSGFVSLTDNMKVAHAFGQNYESAESGYYIYTGKMGRGVWLIDPPFPSESEHSAIGPVPIISYRKCVSNDDHRKECSSIFIKKNIPIELKKKLIAVQLLPSEKLKNPFFFDSVPTSNAMLQFDKDDIITSLKVINFSPEPIQKTVQLDKAHLNNHKKNLALEIYQDLIHIRDHTLYHSYTKEVPKLLRLPVVSFIAAMNNNQDPKHPIHAVRNSMIDMGVEKAALTTIGLAIGDTPAAIALMASHLVEAGLERFPSWEQIEKMPCSTPHERLAKSRMIEVRGTAELLAWPGKATQILSHYIKSWIDDTFSKKQGQEDLPRSKLLSAATSPHLTQAPLPSNLSISGLMPHENLDTTLMQQKQESLSLFPSKSLSLMDNKLLELPKKAGVPESTMVPKTDPIISTCSKFNGLSDSKMPQTAWDNIRLRSRNEKISPHVYAKGLSLGNEPKDAFDLIRLQSNFATPPTLLTGSSMWIAKSFEAENQSTFQNLQSNSSFHKGFPGLFSETRVARQGLSSPFPDAILKHHNFM